MQEKERIDVTSFILNKKQQVWLATTDNLWGMLSKSLKRYMFEKSAPAISLDRQNLRYSARMQFWLVPRQGVKLFNMNEDLYEYIDYNSIKLPIYVRDFYASHRRPDIGLLPNRGYMFITYNLENISTKHGLCPYLHIRTMLHAFQAREGGIWIERTLVVSIMCLLNT